VIHESTTCTKKVTYLFTQPTYHAPTDARWWQRQLISCTIHTLLAFKVVIEIKLGNTNPLQSKHFVTNVPSAPSIPNAHNHDRPQRANDWHPTSLPIELSRPPHRCRSTQCVPPDDRHSVILLNLESPFS
ncbi:unnamed protein product, partial [Clonostachys rhizophaga]